MSPTQQPARCTLPSPTKRTSGRGGTNEEIGTLADGSKTGVASEDDDRRRRRGKTGNAARAKIAHWHKSRPVTAVTAGETEMEEKKKLLLAA